MLATIGAICAYLLGMKKFVPNWDRLITETHWQSFNGTWAPMPMPVTYFYSPQTVDGEILCLALALIALFFCWRARNLPKDEGVLARYCVVITLGFILYVMMTWAARHHVEGDWKAVPPALHWDRVSTPEYEAQQAAQKAAWKAAENVRKGLTPTGERIYRKLCLDKMCVLI